MQKEISCKNKKLKENLKMRQKWKRFVMHVEKQKKNCHNFLKNICGKRGQKGQNVKQKQNKKKETRHGKVFQAGRMQKKKWE